jgi:hypothetical protein
MMKRCSARLDRLGYDCLVLSGSRLEMLVLRGSKPNTDARGSQCTYQQADHLGPVRSAQTSSSPPSVSASHDPSPKHTQGINPIQSPLANDCTHASRCVIHGLSALTAHLSFVSHDIAHGTRSPQMPPAIEHPHQHPNMSFYQRTHPCVRARPSMQPGSPVLPDQQLTKTKKAAQPLLRLPMRAIPPLGRTVHCEMHIIPPTHSHILTTLHGPKILPECMALAPTPIHRGNCHSRSSATRIPPLNQDPPDPLQPHIHAINRFSSAHHSVNGIHSRRTGI